MIRTILLTTTTLLALAGAAQAANVVKVSVQGKTEAAIKSELAGAARAVCSGAFGDDYQACVQASYATALQHWEKMKAARLATFTF